MDKSILVKEGQDLIRLLDETAIKPKGAVWVYSSDADRWRLWIVPQDPSIDKVEFYRMVSDVLSAHRDLMPTLDVGLVELKSATHPAVVGLGGSFHMEGIGAATFENNRFNGYLLPDGVILRMAI